MKSEYKRDINGNYLVLYENEEPDTSSYQMRMLVGNSIPSILKCRVQGVDGQFMAVSYTHLDVYKRQVVAPVALNGPILTIRRFPDTPITMEKLIELGSITPECASFLEKLVRARYSIVIGGGTGSGKTTFLGALSEYIPKDERIITCLLYTSGRQCRLKS